MKSEEQLAESIERFQEVFWEKRSTGRPPVGVVNRDVFLPIKYLHAPFERSEVTPEGVNRKSVTTDYEFGFAAPAVTCDDWIPYSAPWRAIPWLEACCGCPVRYSSGSLCPEHFVSSLEALDKVAIPADNGWFRCMERQTEQLVASAPADCWISPSILRGPSDVVAAMRGQSEFFVDLHDDPGAIDRAAACVNRLLLDALDMHFHCVEPKRGGFGHIYGYWAPEKTVVIQEDAMGMCSPAVYRDVFQKYNAEVVEHFGKCVLFHLHSTGFQHYRHVLDTPGIAGLEFTVEMGGPPLPELVPVLREILERSRLILMVDHGFEHLPEVLGQLPREGLYVVAYDTDIPNNETYRQFVAAKWKS